MRAIVVMFDSLNRLSLPSYGGSVKLPNFERLAQRTVTFDRNYVGSLPCMPARRELHTGRLNFLHRGWGPLEPFDDSMPELLAKSGVHTHLSTDHYHYLEDGGATYHNRYSTWECIRGQEGDHWKGDAGSAPETSRHMLPLTHMKETAKRMKMAKAHQDEVNRQYIKSEDDFPQTKTFNDGLEFIKNNQDKDQWFLQIEAFDPHEPFFSPDYYQEEIFGCIPGEEDWPPYAPVTQTPDVVNHMQKKYDSLLKMCDQNLGRILDAMDTGNMWNDTMLIVNTDHGLLIGEHDWWGKGLMPDYEEITHTPLYIWDPRYAAAGIRSEVLTQTIDLAPTLLDFFGVNIPADMQGNSLGKVLENEEPIREYALFGYFAASLNITDGRYVYMCSPIKDAPRAFEYTLMPTHMNMRFFPQELANAELSKGFSFTKDCPVLKVPALFVSHKLGETALFDLMNDPKQQHPLQDEVIESRMRKALVKKKKKNEAPEELYARFGLERERNYAN